MSLNNKATEIPATLVALLTILESCKDAATICGSEERFFAAWAAPTDAMDWWVFLGDKPVCSVISSRLLAAPFATLATALTDVGCSELLGWGSKSKSKSIASMTEASFTFRCWMGLERLGVPRPQSPVSATPVAPVCLPHLWVRPYLREQTGQ